MEWISVKDRLPIGDGVNKVLVAFLEPFFGGFTLEIDVGYYDNPDDYEDGNGEGWKSWYYNREILVTHWATLPEKPWSEFDGMMQNEFEEKFNGFRPHLGSVFNDHKS